MGFPSTPFRVSRPSQSNLHASLDGLAGVYQYRLSGGEAVTVP